MKIKKIDMIEEADFSELVQSTYGKPYRFQQQDGCKDRGTLSFKVPCTDYIGDEYSHDEIPEELNGHLMCVKFKKWLERDPNQPVGEYTDKCFIDMFWHRNFYPDFYILVNDLHAKGLIEAGDYTINIDW